MNKKFFTLLVAFLATISFGAFAQGIVVGSTPSSFSSTKAYLLETTVDGGGKLYLSLDNSATPGLVALPQTTIEASYATLQKALWYVTASTIEGNSVYEFKNAYNSMTLTLNSEDALSSLLDAEGDENLLSGDLAKWNGNRGQVKPGTDFFFNYTNNTNNADEVVVMALTEAGKVALVLFDNKNAVTTAVPTAAVLANAKVAAEVQAVQAKLASKMAAVLTASKAMNDGWAAADNDGKDALIAAVNTAATALTTEMGLPENTVILGTNAIATPVGTYQTALNAAASTLASLTNATTAGDITSFNAEVVKLFSTVTTEGTYKATLNTALATAVAAASNAMQITPKVVQEGNLTLNANDINTLLGTKGVYDSSWGKIMATKDSYFNLNIEPKNTIDNPFSGELQALGVTFTETAANLVNDNLALVTTDAFADQNLTWVALYSKAGEGYVVVDTSFINGTPQTQNGLIETKINKDFWDKDAKSKLRLADSYLFQFTYDATNNTIVIQSKAYVSKPVNVGTQTSPKYSWDKTNAGVTIVNSEDAAPSGYSYNFSYFTFAQLGSEVAYTFGQPLFDDMIIKLVTATASYQPTRVPQGVYLLQVTGTDKANKNIGKYLRMSLDGEVEFIDVDPSRQNLQHIPAAQWVIESTTSNYGKITNREFGYQVAAGTTYKTATNGEFFYLAGGVYLGSDTLKYVAVEAANQRDEKLGYLFVDQDGYQLDSYTFRYLHDLSMDNPVSVAANGKMFVNKEDKPSYFRLEAVTTVPYGYNGNLTGVAQLERTVYQIAAFETINFDGDKQYVTYDPAEKKYFLLDEEDFEDSYLVPSAFLLKENYEVATEEGEDCYYVLAEANLYYPTIADAVYMPLNSKGELTGVEYPAWVAGIDASDLVQAKYNNSSKKWENVGAINFLPTDNGFYSWSKVSVDNSSLALVNGVLADSQGAEVANSAFKVGPDDSIIYRTIGAKEDEDPLEQNIRIFRINSTAKEYLYEDANSVYSVGPNKPSDERENISDQINFLGVEGKGDDKLSEAVMTARYVRGTVMPQYLLMLNYHETDPTSSSCPVCDAQGFITPGCPHHDSKDGYATARVLVSFADSVAHYADNAAERNKFRWNTHTRLGFVNAKFSPGAVTGVKDSTLTILNTSLKDKANEANVYAVKFSAAETKKEGSHKPVFFSMRLIDENADDFLLESNGTIGGTTNMTWVRIHNGVPVLSDKTNFSDAVRSEAEIFNLETTDDIATSNEGIEAGKVSVVAGVGNVTIKGAAGQQVVVANILGQVVYTGVLSSDEQTITAPAGVVVVSVAGEATKALVK